MATRIIGAVALWVVVTGAALLVPRLIPATGDGFTRGANRLPVALALHGAALLVALVTAGISWRARAELGRTLLLAGLAPLLLDALLVGALLALLLGGG